jgi:nucleoside-diphosphate-sugar epimerase
MQVFVAGATGTIGASLIRQLLTSGHEVIGLRRQASGQADVRWVTADVLDRDALLRAVRGCRADSVISELSALKKPPVRHRDMATTNILRTRGTANLLEVARQIGARRFVTQSMMFGYGYYDQGARLRRESEPFAPERQGPWEPHLAAMRENERMVLTDPAVEGVALRYAIYYGARASQSLVDGVAHRKLPVLANASALSWIHVDDAASATVAALERGEAGQAYNIADDDPVSWTNFIGYLARALDAPNPRTLPSGLLKVFAPYGYAVLRGGVCLANDKAKQELHWRPATPSYRLGLDRLAYDAIQQGRLREAA